MNTPTPSSEHPSDALAGSRIRSPAIAFSASDTLAAANDDDAHQPGHDDGGVNPLWMITITLGILVGTMALFVATS